VALKTFDGRCGLEQHATSPCDDGHVVRIVCWPGLTGMSGRPQRAAVPLVTSTFPASASRASLPARQCAPRMRVHRVLIDAWGGPIGPT
jgi:hypothetical protein